MESTKKQNFRLKYLPISFFSIILGLAGFSIGFQKIEEIFLLNSNFSLVFLIITSLIFILISVLYLLKSILYFSEIKKEFNHPIKLNFFPTISISFLLLSIAYLHFNENISKILWIIGAVLHLIFTIKILSIWIHHTKFEIKHMNPAWFIPTVGNIIVPIAGVVHFSKEISWFYFSIGFFLWLGLFIIFLNRIIFHTPLHEKMLPTLFILIAPPAIGFISLVRLIGEINEFSKVLYYFGLFLTILLLFQIKVFSNIKFYLSWWAYSFPIAAITIATTLMFEQTRFIFFKYLSAVLFFFLLVLIIILLAKTIQAILNKEICIVEEE